MCQLQYLHNIVQDLSSWPGRLRRPKPMWQNKHKAFGAKDACWPCSKLNLEDPFKIAFRKFKDVAMSRNSHMEPDKIILVRWVDQALKQSFTNCA